MNLQLWYGFENLEEERFQRKLDKGISTTIN
jgi:hypothetical protein